MASKEDTDLDWPERPFEPQTKVFGDLMDKYFRIASELELTEARTTEEFFGFHRNDVARLHYHKQGFGPALFLRLHDGRVFDMQARPHDPDRSWYDQTTH